MIEHEIDFDEALSRAISHAVNYHGVDAKLGMADHEIGTLLALEVSKHLAGVTDSQKIDRMTPEDRSKIGR